MNVELKEDKSIVSSSYPFIVRYNRGGWKNAIILITGDGMDCFHYSGVLLLDPSKKCKTFQSTAWDRVCCQIFNGEVILKNENV